MTGGTLDALAGTDQPSRYRRVVSHIRDTPWAILPSTFASILDVISYRASGGHLTSEEIQTLIGAGPASKPASQSGAVAVIPIYGVIAPKVTMMSEISGGTSLEVFSSQLRAAVADAQVGSILFDVNSPGGTIDLVPETAALIRQARSKKPVTAQVNTTAGSAAYWLASQADEIVVTPSGEVGSIGVFAAHDDLSAAMERAGVKTTLISAGKYKTDLSPFQPLSDEARAAVQQTVDEFYGMFVSDVAKGRGVAAGDVRGGFGEGRMVTAKTAVQMGMADRIGTFEQTVARMARGDTGSRNAAFAFLPAGATITLGTAQIAGSRGWLGAGYAPAPYQQEPDETVECPNCNKANEPDARYCDQCGLELVGRDDVETEDPSAPDPDDAAASAETNEHIRSAINHLLVGA